MAACSVRYLLKFPLWADECFLAISFAQRGYLGLLEPLAFHQIAPPLFLWVELSMVKLLGFSEWPLRLMPFAFAIAGLFLFRKVAGELVHGSALLLSVGIFAVSYFIIRYSAEVKPVSLDVLVTLILLWLALRWWRDPGAPGPLWVLAAFVPLALALSYPAVFVAGGISAFALCVLWRSQDHRSRWAWVGLNVALGGAFAGMLLLTAYQQSDADLAWMRAYWDRAFPPLDAPAQLPLWLLAAHTGEMLPYPIGGKHGASTFTLLLCAAGLVTLWRTRRFGHLVLFLSPIALNFMAAAIRRYPYGAPTRGELYLAPIFCILAGLGAATVLGWAGARWPSRARVALSGALASLALVGVVTMGRDVWRPAKTTSDQRFRDFARWFWPTMEYQGEVICVRTDLNLTFCGEKDGYQTPFVNYLCHQRIYSPRHAAGEPYRLDTLSADHPLRVVDYRIYGACDTGARDRWLEEFKMEHALKLVSVASYAVPYLNKTYTKLMNLDFLDVYTLVPVHRPERSTASDAEPAS